MDRRFVGFIAEHIDLLLAVTAWGVALWSVFTGEAIYVLALAAVGAVSFFVGFIPSLGVSALIELIFVIDRIRGNHWLGTAVLMVEAFGYGCVAWLGFRHREQQRLQKEMVMSTVHNDSVMPWVVANEIRTSLAAIRFLLFPLHEVESKGDSTDESLRQATRELQRLEKIFTDMEKSQAERLNADSQEPLRTGRRTQSDQHVT